METSPSFTLPPADHRPHLIPSWMVPFLAMPFRKWVDDPARSVLPLIRPGMRILEVGPGSGFFTLPMAQATGITGALACVELQEPVRRRLQAKLCKKGLAWVEVRPCSARDLQVADLEGCMDLAVAIDVLHEMPEPTLAILRMHQSLRSGGRMLLLEPRGHCSEAVFSAEKTWAAEVGFTRLQDPAGLGARRHGALFQKP